MSQVETEKDVNYQQELHALPDGWSWTPLGEICDAINGRAFKSTEWRDSGVPIIRIQNLKSPDASFNYFQGELEEKNKVRAGDLLFAWSGTPGTSFGAHIWRGQDAALNQHIFNVQFDRTQIDTKYFCYALNQNVSRYVAQAQGGVGLAHITKSKFMASKVPIAPLDQQKHIVAEIEKQFSRLDEAVANLKRVKANLKRYKAAVLKAAVEGRLVEAEAEIARREGRSYETGAQLLQRILATRRSQWKGKGKNNEPTAPGTKDLPELPEGWTCCSGAQLFEWSSGEGLTEKNQRPGPYPVYGGNGINGHHDKYFVEEPTLVVGRVGAHCGNVYVTMPNCWITDNAIYAKPYPENTVLQYFQIVFSEAGLNRIAAGSGQPFVNQRMLNEVLISLPPNAEQRRIVAEVDRRLSLVHEVESQIDANVTRSDRLRQAILRKAFSGLLVQHEHTGATMLANQQRA